MPAKLKSAPQAIASGRTNKYKHINAIDATNLHQFDEIPVAK